MSITIFGFLEAPTRAQSRRPAQGARQFPRANNLHMMSKWHLPPPPKRHISNVLTLFFSAGLQYLKLEDNLY